MTETSPDFDFLAKIIIIGESRVGKTSMWHQYYDKKFSYNFCCTVGVDLKVKKIEVDGKRARLQIWDTAGQERFGPLTQMFFRGSNGVLLCYAINNRESFEKIEYWMEEVKKYSNNKDVCMVLVGMKSDLQNERAVGFDEGRKKADSLGIKFFETSAKNNVNVDEAFLIIAKDIKEALDKKEKDELSKTQINSKENKSSIEGNCFKCS